jgi:CRP-like cAMP-binding protein
MVSPELLRRHPMFGGLSHDQLRRIAVIADEVSYQAGEWILHQGDIPDRLYIIIRGQVDLCVNLGFRDRRHMDITTINEGGLLGWSAVTGDSRMASARARTSVDAIAIDGGHLRALFAEDSAIQSRIMQHIVMVIRDRLQAVMTQFASVLSDWSAFVADKNSHERIAPK